MKFGVGVLTHNAIRYFRLELLEQTIASLREAFPGAELLVLDNGSTDGTEKFVAVMPDGMAYRPVDGNTSPGRGMNVIADVLLARGVDVVVHSDDDMLWRIGAQKKLEIVFSGRIVQHVGEQRKASPLLVSGYLEPVWDWNTPRETITYYRSSFDSIFEPVNVLVRDSAPACAWAYMAKNYKMVFPLIEEFGQDAEACKRLLASGHRVAQLDLAEHKGWDYSTWGNKAIVGGRPLDREKWKI